MSIPWIENYRGHWSNRTGFEIVVRPLDEKAASVDISLHGHPILRPWNSNSPCENLNGLYRGDDGLGLEVDLGREGFSLFLDYECPGDLFEVECITAGLSRWAHDQDAERWMSSFGLDTYFRREPDMG